MPTEHARAEREMNIFASHTQPELLQRFNRPTTHRQERLRALLSPQSPPLTGSGLLCKWQFRFEVV